MQAEESVEIENRFLRDVDAGPHGVILRLPMRHHDVQPVRGAALKNYNQALGSPAILNGSERRPFEKTRQRCRADHGQCTVTKKNPTSDGHRKLLASS